MSKKKKQSRAGGAKKAKPAARETFQVTFSVAVDFDSKGRVVGIEIISTDVLPDELRTNSVTPAKN